jgi:hypothetical protein
VKKKFEMSITTKESITASVAAIPTESEGSCALQGGSEPAAD